MGDLGNKKRVTNKGLLGDSDNARHQIRRKVRQINL